MLYSPSDTRLFKSPESFLCLEFQRKDFICGINYSHHSLPGTKTLCAPGALLKDSMVAVRAWFIPQRKMQVKTTWPIHAASSLPRTPGGLLGQRGVGVGLERQENGFFKKCKLPSPITPNRTNEVSLGSRLCHIKSCLGMLQTYHNYLMDSGLRQS